MLHFEGGSEICSICGSRYTGKDTREVKGMIVLEWCDGCQEIFGQALKEKYEYYKATNIKLSFWQRMKLGDVDRVAYQMHRGDLESQKDKDKIAARRDKASKEIDVIPTTAYVKYTIKPPDA